MIKYLALGVISVIVSTFSACVLKNLRGKPSPMKDGDGYGFYLGCAWFVTAVISGVISAVSGHLLIGITYFLLSLCGVASVVFSVFYGGGHHKISNDAAETSSCDSGKEQFGSEKQGENNVSYRQKICPETATDDRSRGVFADLCRVFTEKPRSKAIICCIVFLSSVVVFSLFAVFSSATVNEEGDGYGFGDAVEVSVVFESCEVGGGVAFLKANNGSDTYVLHGYSLPLCDIDHLRSEIGAGSTFTVRATVMRRDRWNGYFALTVIKDEAGEEYLEEASVLEARMAARAEKLAAFGIVTLLSGGALGFYAVTAVREAKRKNKI